MERVVRTKFDIYGYITTCYLYVPISFLEKKCHFLERYWVLIIFMACTMLMCSEFLQAFVQVIWHTKNANIKCGFILKVQV